jgi:DNA modification methylase/methylase of polypeptide subunit release factors
MLNKIHNINCIDGMKKLEENSADIIICDPPYNIGKKFGNNTTNISIEEYLKWCKNWINECIRILKPDGTLYIYGYSETLAFVRTQININVRWIIWHYTNKVCPSLNFWQRSHESILVCSINSKPIFNRDDVREPYTESFIKNAAGKKRKSTKGRFSNGKKETVYKAHANGALPRDIIKIPALAGGAGKKERVEHPTQKPLALCEKLIKAAINKDIDKNTIVVPFSGSGSECLAAQNLNHNFIGFEINPKYIELSNIRLVPNISSNYDLLKTYVNDNLNKNPNLVKTSNDVPTPIECVEEMLSKIPTSYLKNPNLKWLDPCCGCGNFFIVAFNLLNKYHEKKHILENMLYFNDTNEDRIAIVKQIFQNDKYKLNISSNDFLQYDNSKKYDIITANPPYAKLLPSGKRASKNHNLIGSFIKQSLNILNEKGLIVYITPDNWMSYADRNTLISTLTSKQILHLNIHTAKKYFKKIGSSFTWYVIENSNHYKNINIEGIWNKNIYQGTVKSMVRNYIPLYYNKIIQNILFKTIDADNKKFPVETTSFLHKYTKKIHIRIEKDDTFKYKLIHTPSQTVWADIPHKFQDGFKVFIGTTSYYKTFVDNCGMTQSIAFIRCKNEKNAIKINKILNHPLYKFINNICRWGNFNNIRILQHFPHCKNFKKIYTTFNINKEEQDFIINNI